MNDPQFSPPSDLELLAAFIENRLSETERRQVEERLAHDEDFYEVYTETLQTLEELEDTEPVPLTPTPIAPRFDRRSWTRALSLAAGLILVSGLVLTWAMPRYLLGSTDPTGLSTQLADQSEWHLSSLDQVLRGGGDGSDPLFGEWQSLGIRLGARIIDLQVALETGHWKVAQQAARRQGEDLEDHPLLPMDPEGFFKTLASSLVPPKGAEHPDLAPGEPERHLRVLAEKDKLFDETYDELDSRAYHLGKWLESTRLIALSQDERSLRKRLRRLPAAERIVLQGNFEEHKLQQSRDILDRLKLLRSADDDKDLDFKAIAKQLEELIVVLGKKSPDHEYF